MAPPSAHVSSTSFGVGSVPVDDRGFHPRLLIVQARRASFGIPDINRKLASGVLILCGKKGLRPPSEPQQG